VDPRAERLGPARGEHAQRLGRLLDSASQVTVTNVGGASRSACSLMRARAAPGASQRCAAISAPSTRTAASAGASAAKNQVSKRFGIDSYPRAQSE